MELFSRLIAGGEAPSWQGRKKSSTGIPFFMVSYSERITRLLPLPFWLTLILLWETTFLVDYLLRLSIPGAHDHIVEFGCLILFFAWTCITIVFCSGVLVHLFTDLLLFIDHDDAELKEWYGKQLLRSYSSINRSEQTD